jgi:hypothetical protein
VRLVGHERRTGRGLFFLYTQKVKFFPVDIDFLLRTVYCSQVSAERAVFFGYEAKIFGN